MTSRFFAIDKAGDPESHSGDACATITGNCAPAEFPRQGAAVERLLAEELDLIWTLCVGPHGATPNRSLSKNQPHGRRPPPPTGRSMLA